MRTIWTSVAFSSMLAGQALADGKIVGGYSPSGVKQPEIVNAARVAVESKNALPETKPVNLVEIRQAEQQVVAGMNYRLCLVLNDGSREFPVLAVVYADLSGKLSLTEWKPDDC